MGHVVFAAASADRAASDLLAGPVRKAGWGVRHVVLSAAEAADRSAALQEIASAHAVLLVWSAQAGPAIAEVDAALVQAAGDRLVLIRIDAAAPPDVNARIVDLSETADLGSPVAEARLVSALGAPDRAAVSASLRTEHLVSQTDPTSQAAPRPRLAVSWRVGAVVLVGLALVGASIVLAWPRAPVPVVAANDPSAGSAGAPSAPGQAEARRDGDGRADWRDAADRGAAAIRAYLARAGDGPYAEEARALLAQLDAQAWSDVLGGRHVEDTLDRLRVYREQFPDGAFQADAITREADARSRIAAVRTALAELGLLPDLGVLVTPSGGLDPDLVAAVRAFQREARLTPTGHIDRTLELALAERMSAAPAMVTEATRPTPGVGSRPAGDVFRDCYVCPEMVVLPAGAFVMGDTTGMAPSDERPAHTVSIGYQLAVGRYEVTLEEWRACVSEAACRALGDDGVDRVNTDGRLPAGNVAPSDVDDFLAWLSRKTGEAYRLPSEAEWEYAARAGTSDAWISGNLAATVCAFGNGADRSSSYAWRNDACSDGETGPARVGTFGANAFGLYDTMGNLWEWTADCWHASYEGAPVDGSAWTQACDSTDRVLRGGSYSVESDKLRSSFRYRFAARAMPFFGFRVARLLS